MPHNGEAHSSGSSDSQLRGDSEFPDCMRQLDRLLQDVESMPDPAVRASTGKVIQTLMDFHGAALAALVEAVAGSGPEGPRLLEEAARDKLAGSLLLIYGLHPLTLEQRIRSALESVRPYLKSHGGNVELLGVSESGIVRLRMQGSCHGCPSSAATLKNSIEQAIVENAPDAGAIEVEGVETPAPPPPAQGFVPIEQLTAGHGRRAAFIQGALS